MSEIPYKSSLDAKYSEFLSVILVPVLGILFYLPCDKTWETRVVRLPSFQPRLNPQHLCRSPDFWEVSLDLLCSRPGKSRNQVSEGGLRPLSSVGDICQHPVLSMLFSKSRQFFFPCLCFPSVQSKLAGHHLALSLARDLKWENIFPSAQKPREAIQDTERAVLVRSSREAGNRQS